MLFNLEDELDLDLNTDSLADSLESVVEPLGHSICNSIYRLLV